MPLTWRTQSVWSCAVLMHAICHAALASETEAPMYACGATSKGYVVGAALPPSGLFAYPGEWRQRGFNHPTINAAAFDPHRPGVLYLAAGNGCIRADRHGAQWTILTDWRMTELQDIALDPARPGAIYVALLDGVGYSGDGGLTWSHRDDGLPRKFVQTIAVDRTRADRVLAGAERGIFSTADAGLHWKPVGADGKMIVDLAQSARDPRLWMATAQSGGLFRSTDNGATWTPAGRFAGRTLYSVALDPSDANRAAISGWNEGVMISEDRGVTWIDRGAGLPSRHVWRVSFDPRHPKRLWVSVHEEAVFVSEDLGLTWRRSGLEGSIVRDFVFPEAAR